MDLLKEFFNGFWKELRKSYRPLPPLEENVPHEQPSRSRPIVAGPRRPGSVVVGPDTRPLWQIRGWQKNGQTLTGAYRTPRGSFLGRIDLKWGQPSFFILNPPAAVLSGRHSACFRPREEGWYWIHFSKDSKEIDSGLVAIEVLIHQALRGRN
jgi:hypothetical protein